jgi:hypothetical protein
MAIDTHESICLPFCPQEGVKSVKMSSTNTMWSLLVDCWMRIHEKVESIGAMIHDGRGVATARVC